MNTTSLHGIDRCHDCFVVGYPYKRPWLTKNITKFLFFLTLKLDSWRTHTSKKCKEEFCLVVVKYCLHCVFNVVLWLASNFAFFCRLNRNQAILYYRKHQLLDSENDSAEIGIIQNFQIDSWQQRYSDGICHETSSDDVMDKWKMPRPQSFSLL